MAQIRKTSQMRLTAIPFEIYRIVHLRQSQETLKRVEKGISVGNAKPSLEQVIYTLIKETDFYKENQK